MALVSQDQPGLPVQQQQPIPQAPAVLLPITIPEAIQQLGQLGEQILRKNQTLINWYIHPYPTPPNIVAFQPRIEIILARLRSISYLSLPRLTMMVDNAEALVAFHLLPIADQLINAVVGIQDIFTTSYDAELPQRRPYITIYDTLEYRERQLKKFQENQMVHPACRAVEDLSPVPSGVAAAFCPAAIAFANRRDSGKVSLVMWEDLLPENRARLRAHHGAFLWWECPTCTFRLQFYLRNSNASSIHATDDVRSHDDLPQVEYRSAWLVKCHLYQSTPRSSSPSVSWPNRRTTTSVALMGLTRRRTEVAPSGLWMTPARRVSDYALEARGQDWPERYDRRERHDRQERYDRQERHDRRERYDGQGRYIRSRPVTAKYGCPFCFSTGEPLAESYRASTVFQDGHDLAAHIVRIHHRGRPAYQPCGLMLDKYNVGVCGRMSERVGRRDLNLK